MKNTTFGALALALLSTLFFMGGTLQSRADHDHDNHNGHWDRHHHWQNYTYYNGHRGYWDERDNGPRIWISIP